MSDELRMLQQRIDRLESSVGEIRDRLINCVKAADRPEDSVTLARGVAENLTKLILEKISIKPDKTFDACLRQLEKPEVMSRGLVPNEILSMLHLVRVTGNGTTHDLQRIQVRAADVHLVLSSILRVVEWYFSEFERGPKIALLFRAADAEQAYLECICSENELVVPRGIASSPLMYMPKLVETMVTLKAVKLRTGVQLADKMLLHHEAIDGEPRDLDSILQNNPQMVLLGDPGSGKTTWLRYLAWQAADNHLRSARNHVTGTRNTQEECVPILIRLADYAENRKSEKPIALDEFLVTHVTRTPETQASLKAALDRGRALLLLDGLDEIADPRIQNEVVMQIERLVLWYKNRVVVTCRVAGYADIQIGARFAVFLLREMDWQQIETFVENWYRALEQARDPSANPEIRDIRVRMQADQILEALKQNEGTCWLASTPLFLRALVQLHKAEEQLPRRRIELYRAITQTLLDNWQVAKGVSCPVEKKAKEQRLLDSLAYAIHIQNDKRLSDSTTTKILKDRLAVFHNLSPDSLKVEEECGDLLRRMRQNTGIFVYFGDRQFGFVHPTFQEYFVARELLNRKAVLQTTLQRHRYSGHWHEPILLTIGQISMTDSTEASRLIREAILPEDADDDILQRNLLMALYCLSSCVDVEPDLLHDVVERLVALYQDVNGRGRYAPLRRRLREAIGALRKSLAEPFLHTCLLKMSETESETMRLEAKLAIHWLDRSYSEIPANSRREYMEAAKPIQKLLDELTETNKDKRGQAVEALGHRKDFSESVLQAVLKALNDPAPFVQEQAERSLANLIDRSDAVLPFLLNALQLDEYNHSRIVRALAHHHRTSRKCEGALLTLLQESGNCEQVRAQAALGLGYILIPTPEIMSVLQRVSKEDGSSLVRWYATLALAHLKSDAPDVFAQILAATRSGENGDIRGDGAVGLQHLGRVSLEVIEALLPLLNHDEVIARECAAIALGELCAMPEASHISVREQVVTALRGLLENPLTNGIVWDGGYSYTDVHDYVWEALWKIRNAGAEEAYLEAQS